MTLVLRVRFLYTTLLEGNITKAEFVAKHNATFHADFVHSYSPKKT
jgi:hypothetical protein